MAELVAADVESYTGGRLLASDPLTAVWLDRALKAVRRYCGWHVTPVRTDTGVVLNGRGGRVLSLPTLHLVTLTALSENGTALDVGSGVPGGSTGDVYLSPEGEVRKVSCGCWTSRFSGVTVTMSHGFDAATDWQSAVLEMVDRLSQMPGTVIGNSGPMARKRVDDVEYQWALSVGSNVPLFDLIDHRLVDPYRLEPFG